jgi:hypothetical protein
MEPVTVKKGKSGSIWMRRKEDHSFLRLVERGRVTVRGN